MAVATLSINPRRDVVLISLSVDIESDDLTDAWLVVDGTKAEEGPTMARAAHAADRRDDAVMVRKLSVRIVMAG